MTPLLVLVLVSLATMVTAWLLRETTLKAPATIIAFGLVLLLGYGVLLTYQRSIAQAAQRACRSRVEGRDDLRGQFENLYGLFRVGFAGNEFVLSLVDTAENDLDAEYPALDPAGCDASPYIALPFTDPTTTIPEDT